MEQFDLPSSIYYALCLLFAVLVYVLIGAKSSGAAKKPSTKLPPGPWQLPVIGSLHHLLGGLPHHVMRDLSQRYGPLMLIRICERVAVVVSSAEAAREIFKGHDVTFEQRPSSPGIDELYRHGEGIIFAPYGDHWRQLRRIVMTELLGVRRVEAFQRIREDEAARLVSSLASTPPDQPINVGERLDEFIADASVRAMFGDRLPDRAAFLKMVRQIDDIASLFDLRDLFPSSRLVRMIPRSGKAERHRREMFRLMDDILSHHEERRAAAGGGDDEQDMIDVLLRIQKEGDMRVSLTNGVIRTVLTELFGAAVDTSSTTLQWAMAELMANPKVLEKAQLETRHFLAGHARVQEVQLNNLSYIKAIIKETLRMHPPGSLVPRVCFDDLKIQGYDVPQGTTVLTNVYAISRDPKYWKNPDMFMPERFLVDTAFDYKGFDFEYTPFGTSRRICPGMNFATANIEIALASLLYHFDWKLPVGVSPEKLDMTEVFGVTARRKAELLLHPIPIFHM
ncbi:hypothetical protein BS78_01G230200 [Paspalum vaginatum]|nr:hypothetical protein BS78_01G230200 [Paspalum vaginatum]